MKTGIHCFALGNPEDDHSITMFHVGSQSLMVESEGGGGEQLPQKGRVEKPEFFFFLSFSFFLDGIKVG